MPLTSTHTFGNIQLTPEAMHELQDNRPILTLRRADIRSLHLRHGFLARHPILQMIFAGALIIATLYPLAAAVNLLRGGLIHALLWLPLVFTFLGIYLLYDALRQGHFIEVTTTAGTRKLSLGKSLSPNEASKLSSHLADYLR